MNSPFSIDEFLVGLCAVSFVTTGIFLLLSVLGRISFNLRTRLLQLIFSFGLTTVVAVLLARASDPIASRAIALSEPRGVAAFQPFRRR